jgi:hypothetical protein
MACLFGAFVLSFGSLIASIWIYVDLFGKKDDISNKYAGVTILLNNILIIVR